MNSYVSLTSLVAAAIFFYRKSKSHKENKTVASSLNLSAPSSSLPHKSKHHVFLSFHGADVRTTFLSHVLKELKSKGIDPFIDNEIKRSNLIGTALIEALRGSRIAIVFLSHNYASSTWCLNELVEIMRCREEFGQTVMSLFYQVDPTDVRKQTGDFGKVFRKTCIGKTEEEIRRWKHALMEVAQIAGYHSTNWETEAEMIENIATDVSNKLNISAPSTDFDGLVGMESRMTEMRRLLQLDSDEVRKIGILGQPGIGKTTIARFLFNQYSSDYQLSVFMDNIRRNYAITAGSDDYSVKLNLQKQFMSQLTNETGIKVPHLGVAKDRLKDKKVLVVLDDVDHLVQLEAMVKETSWFGPGSRIIVTTQDQKVLKASLIDHIHRVNLPSDDEALQIFCMYAFSQKDPKDGFMELSWEATSLVSKLPLGLRFMGSYFRGMSEKDWTEALPKLTTHLDGDGEIATILKFNYDALHDEEKSLFLHIACFFANESVDIVKDCLANCFCDVTQGLHILAEKYLIHMESGYIKMAELLVQLGRKIVRDEYVSEPGKRQFLHDAINIGEVLSNDKAGSSNVTGMDLGFGVTTCTSERAFERLSNLQFLRICGRGVNPLSLNYISQKLRVLSWAGCQMPCFPSSFSPKFLVKLEMPGSGLKKLWGGIQPLNNLKWMDLSYSNCLEELPDLSTATNLYDLDLTCCSSLVELPSSIGDAINLKKLNLSYCSSLKTLPLISPVNLVYFNLSYCSNLTQLPFSKQSILFSQNLEFQGKFDRFLDLLIERMCLQQLILCGMKKLESLPPLPNSLLLLDAENCRSLERLDCSFLSSGTRFNFTNCSKLNQEARDLIIQTRTDQYAVLPGTEVPQCFTYRSYGSSLTVKLNQIPLGNPIKFKACFIPGGENVENGFREWGADFSYTIKSGGNFLTHGAKKVHRFLTGHLNTFEFEVETEKVTSMELVFEFGYMECYSGSFGDKRISKTREIKECGILQFM